MKLKICIQIAFLSLLISCKQKDTTVDPNNYEQCSGNQSYKLVSIIENLSAPAYDTIQIVEVNGIDVTNKDTLVLTSFFAVVGAFLNNTLLCLHNVKIYLAFLLVS
jgi:hypothetical protein